MTTLKHNYDDVDGPFCVSCENGDAQRVMQREAHLCMSCSKDDCRGASARCGGCSECIALQWLHCLGEESV